MSRNVRTLTESQRLKSEFCYLHRELIEHVIKHPNGWLTEAGKHLVLLAREHMEYSDNYVRQDCYISITKWYKQRIQKLASPDHQNRG